jgi:hypothetical protein
VVQNYPFVYLDVDKVSSSLDKKAMEVMLADKLAKINYHYGPEARAPCL